MLRPAGPRVEVTARPDVLKERLQHPPRGRFMRSKRPAGGRCLRRSAAVNAGANRMLCCSQLEFDTEGIS